MKKLFLPTFFLLKLTITAFLLFAGVVLYSQTAPVSPTKGGFKIDGALRANVTTPAGDWVPRLNGTAFTAGIDSFVLDSDGIPEDAITTRLRRDAFNTSADDIFTQGAKFNDYISALHWGTGGAPNKNDIHNGMFHASSNPGPGAGSGDQWVFIGGDRLDVSGTSYIDFEFLQGTITVNASTFTGSGGAGGRTIGDINISMEYNNGGSSPKVVIYRWGPSNEAGTAWAWDSTGSSLITQAYAKTNLVNADVPFGAFNLTTYQPYAFVESAINVTQLVSVAGGNCAGLSIRTLWIKTKASSSSTAALKDLMMPISLNLNFGGVSITDPAAVCEGAASIPLSGTPAGGTFSGTGVSGTNFVPTDAGVGSHRVIYSATLGGGCTKEDTTWIVVNALPTISGTLNVCVGGTTQLTGSATAAASNPWVSSNTSQATVSSTGLVTGVAAGTPTITYTNSNGCIRTTTVTVNALPAQPDVSLTQPTCGNSNGTVTVTAPLDGGGVDYEYNNNGGAYQESVNFTVAAGAAYSIRARNKATQCVSAARTGNMGSPTTTPAATAIIVQNVDCSHSTGTVRIVQASAGNPVYDPAIFEFSSDGTNFGAEDDFEFTAGEGYSLTVRRKSDHTCTATASCPAEDAGARSNTNVTTEATARSLGSGTLEISSVTVKAMPNPFSNQVRFMINNPDAAGSGTLDIYNMAGQKIKTVYQGEIPSGVSFFDLKLATQAQQNLVYVLKIGEKKVTGNLMQLNTH